MNDLADLALKERICDATNRIPTSRWPFFSTTLRATVAEVVGASGVVLSFEAERDTLLTDLSIAVFQEDDGSEVAAQLDIEYCNIIYAENTDVLEFSYCCARKPIFLVGVRENKKLRFAITIPAMPVGTDVNVALTVSGFQGDGCCS